MSCQNALATIALCLFSLTAAMEKNAGAAVLDPEVVVIPAGHFTMGSTAEETSREKMTDGQAGHEHPAHEVQVNTFALAKYSVTRGEFARFVRETGYATTGCTVFDGLKFAKNAVTDWRKPGFAQSDRDPVVCVSWDDAQAYVGWLSRVTGKLYRLPSEAEWEYAARAGSAAARYWGDSASGQCLYANGADQELLRKFPDATVNRDCSDNYAFTAPVGSFRPNAWGLYDMLGNVWQWTADCWNESHEGAPSDARGRADGNCAKRAVRGASWTNDSRALRAAVRVGFDASNRDDDVGFRVAKTLP